MDYDDFMDYDMINKIIQLLLLKACVILAWPV